MASLESLALVLERGGNWSDESQLSFHLIGLKLIVERVVHTEENSKLVRRILGILLNEANADKQLECCGSLTVSVKSSDAVFFSSSSSFSSYFTSSSSYLC